MILYFIALFIFWLFVFSEASINSNIQNYQVTNNKPCFEENRNMLSVSRALGWSQTSEELICHKSNCCHGCCNKSKVLRFNISESCVNFNSFLDSFRNKKLCFFGDSLSQNTYRALLSQLLQFNFAFKSTSGPAKHWTFLTDYNLTVYFHGFYYMKLENETHNYNYNYTHDPNFEESSTFISEVQDCDTAVVNVGLHFGYPREGYTVSFYTEILRFIRGVLERDMKQGKHKKHVYRLTFPQHFPPDSGFSHSGDYYLRNKENKSCERYSQRHWSDLLAQSIFLDSSITILDYYNVLKDAGEYHTSTHEGDCSHYCWNQHLWLPFWGMLETISRRE